MSPLRGQLFFCTLLVAQAVVFHPVMSSLLPRSVLHREDRSSLGRRDSDSCFKTNLQVDYDKYNKLCGEFSDGKHPCFTHWAHNLKNVEVRPWLEPVDIVKQLWVKDTNYTEFAVENPNDAFVVTYLDGGWGEFIYSNFSVMDGCYTISLRKPQKPWRIWASMEGSKDRDVDTEHQKRPSTRFCNSKWTHIHPKQDQPWWAQ